MILPTVRPHAECARDDLLGLVPDNHLAVQDALLMLQLLLDHSIHDCEARQLSMLLCIPAPVLNVVAIAVQLDAVPCQVIARHLQKIRQMSARQ